MNWKKRRENQPEGGPAAEPQPPPSPTDGAESPQEAGGVPESWMPEPEAAAGADEATEQLRRELDAANDKYLRALADYQNLLRRARLNEEEAARQAMTGVLMSIVPVLDHFDFALEQLSKTGAGNPEAVLEGMRAIRAELVKALGSHGVSIINPAPNEEFDPRRHEAVAQQPAGDSGVEPGRVLTAFQAGYALGERVIRPAKVAVAAAG